MRQPLIFLEKHFELMTSAAIVISMSAAIIAMMMVAGVVAGIMVMTASTTMTWSYITPAMTTPVVITAAMTVMAAFFVVVF